MVEQLGKIGHEVLIIAGVHDFNRGIPLSNIIHHHLQNSRLELFHQSAHFPDLDEAEKFVQVVQQFLLRYEK